MDRRLYYLTRRVPHFSRVLGARRGVRGGCQDGPVHSSHLGEGARFYHRLGPSHLKRYYGAGDLHFITCSCYHRQPLLGSAERPDLFLAVLEDVRQKYSFVILGYVVMPEHFHLLITEPQEQTPSVVMQALKLGFARRVQSAMRRSATPLLAQRAREKWGTLFSDHVYFHLCGAVFGAVPKLSPSTKPSTSSSMPAMKVKETT